MGYEAKDKYNCLKHLTFKMNFIKICKIKFTIFTLQGRKSFVIIKCVAIANNL